MNLKRCQLVFPAIVMAVLVASCKPSQPEAGNVSDDTNSASTAVQTMKDYAAAAVTNTETAATQTWAEMSNSFESAMNYTYDNKQEFIDKTRAELAVLDQKIKQLSDQAAQATGSAKADLEAKVASLRDKRAVLDQKLARVKAATQSDWDAAKDDFQSGWNDLKNAVQDAWHSVTAN